ncbi:sodium:proton antiporter NhaD [Propionivibrio sp.]|uniref:sodium:proton antiporter NhaD n=2 Tax=Propionivibrio sp. TaxID=2212460 RepID=UPI0025E056E7|nr:sodium:proton antiporter NhaD [Propionivibrio sp.]MBK7357093.1 sodium:proton antiporter NhaD [Propionivibrio sp.]MBK8745124.1 sodium:proton antiporter NhaD [Propionivibrio sp.]MBK8894113.1 sodium:proton antiporter NhaD [Propionivibrio sp.]MBL0208900.1 sodium:proton antiporter NhaD [Propionivibrio sp.]
MLTTLILVFVVAYTAIALEHPLKVNKSASALLGAGLLWTIYAVGAGDSHLVNEQLAESLMGTAQIVFFLMGAMTIVEVVDAHNGFEVITARIKTTKLSTLMWMVGFVAFFLSSILDNLTTTIVMVSLIKKLLGKHEDRLFFAGIIVIAANAGGAWSPIGDVTTTMLWIGGQITTVAIMEGVLLASLANLIVPLAVTSYFLGARPVVSPQRVAADPQFDTTDFERNLMFFLGLAILVSVPIFKTLTHLPPFLGILFGVGILWLVGDLVHRKAEDLRKQRLTLARALMRIDMSSIVFFIGILLSVAVLEHTHILSSIAQWLDNAVGRQDVIVMLIGLVSAIVDNVPLVAASMGMYSMQTYPPDSFLWEFMAYCAGTGGSILIIGSAAGVAAMGLEKIDFIWYVKKISALALLGYVAGAVVYIVQFKLFH